MLRKILFVLMILFGYQQKMVAQSYYEKPFAANTFAINLDVGLINTFGWGKVKIPPITASMDYGIAKAGPGTIAAGIILGYSRSFDQHRYYTSSSHYSYTYDYYMLALRGSYHLCPGDNDKLDVYAGFLAGYNIVRGKFKSDFQIGSTPPAAEVGHFLGGVYVGGRFYFSRSFGVNAEIGYGISVVNVGACVKF
jgi:hypothetical protein